jgi:hypothetical protein
VVTDLGRFGVGDLFLVDPVLGFSVLRVVDFFVWVDCRLEIFEDSSILRTLAIDKNVKSAVRAASGKLVSYP